MLKFSPSFHVIAEQSFFENHAMSLVDGFEDARGETETNTSSKRLDFMCAPADDSTLLYQQYIDCVTRVMDIHTPIITKVLRHPTLGWITADYRNTKCPRR